MTQPTQTIRTMTFGDLEIAYDDRVLTPRPWTALQSEWAAELLESAPAGPVLELCAGAGQIGLLAVRLGMGPWLTRLLSADPYDEPDHLALIGALRDARRYGEARLAHRRYAERMAQLGVPAQPWESLSA